MANSSVADDARLSLEHGGDDVPEALQIPTQAASAGFQLLLTLANMVIWLSILPIGQILLPTQIAALNGANKFSFLTIATVVGVLAAVITNPIAGALSDRTTSRLGRRRPWFIAGAVFSVVTLALMANATSFVALVIWWGIFHIAANAVLAGLSAVVPDQVPVRQRATVSAFVSLSLPLGAVIGALLVTRVVNSTQLSYYTFIGALLVVMVLFLLVLRDKPLPKGAAPRFNLGTFLAGFWVNPVKYPDFGSTFQIILTGTLLIASVTSGMLSDKFQRRKIFVIGASLVIALAFLILAFFQTWPAVELAAAVLGIGFGAYLGVDIALITQLLPSANARGKDLGIINIANAFPQIVGSTIAALVINAFHSYTILFVLAAILTSLGAVLVQRIKSVR